MPITFSDIVPVQPKSSHSYEVRLEDAWCVGTVPNGGYVTSCFLIAARTHMRLTHAKLNQHDVINLHLEFLRRTSVGPATFVVRDVKIGSRISNLHLTLRQPKDQADPASPIQDEVEGYITISNISAEAGPTDATSYRLRPTPRTVSLHALSADTDRHYVRRRGDPYGTFRRATNHIQLHLLRPSARTPELDNPAIIDQWVRLAPTAMGAGQGRWTNDAIGYIVDIFPQLHERFINGDIEDMLLAPGSEVSDQQILATAKARKNDVNSAKFWYPTLVLNLDIKSRLPDEGIEWLFVRVLAKKMHNGRFDLQVEVWDDPHTGQLVAISSHASLMMDAARNIKRTKEKSKM